MISPSRQAKLGECLHRLQSDKDDAQAWRVMYDLLYPRIMATNYRRLGGRKLRPRMLRRMFSFV